MISPAQWHEVAEGVEHCEHLEAAPECAEGEDQGAEDGAHHPQPETDAETFDSRAPGQRWGVQSLEIIIKWNINLLPPVTPHDWTIPEPRSLAPPRPRPPDRSGSASACPLCGGRVQAGEDGAIIWSNYKRRSLDGRMGWMTSMISSTVYKIFLVCLKHLE